MSALRRVLVVGVVAGLAAAAAAALPAAASAAGSQPATTVRTECFGLYPGDASYGHIKYARGCYGHDEPMLNAESAAAGTATDITWTVILPKDGTVAPVRKYVDMAPTFWFGATVNDPSSLNSQAELEVQFYPDSKLASPFCGSTGSFSTVLTPNTYTSCMPVWAVNPTTFTEYAAFNKMLNVSTSSTTPLVMKAGDTVSVRIYVSGAPAHYNVLVKDVTSGKQSSVIPIVSGTDGPLANAYSTNVHTNDLLWGAVQNTPLSLAWEIGHPNFYTVPRAPECVPGMFNCFSYNVTKGWNRTAAPLQVKSVYFLNGTTSKPSSWSTVDGQGGSDQDVIYCGSYNAAGSGGSCTFPWYSYNGTDTAIVFGGAWPGTTFSEGTYHQYATSAACSGPYGPIYCATTMPNKPPIP